MRNYIKIFDPSAKRNDHFRLSNSNLSLLKIALILKCSHVCVWKTIKSFQKTNILEIKPKSGRKRISTQRDDRRLARLLQKNPKASISWLKNEWHICASSKTVKRRLNSRKLIFIAIHPRRSH